MDHAKGYVGHESTTATPETAHSATLEVTQAARQQGREVLGKASSEARQVLHTLREQAIDAFGESKAQLAEQISGVARAIRSGSEQFHEDKESRLAELGDALAREVEATGDYLKTQDSKTLLDDLGITLRQRRGLLVGSLLVAGAAAAYVGPRLRRSQSPRRSGGASRPNLPQVRVTPAKGTVHE